MPVDRARAAGAGVGEQVGERRVALADVGDHALHDAREHGGGHAADRDPAPRPLPVGGREQRGAVLRGPGEPVEEALLALALLGDRLAVEALGPARVEGADVEEAVELAERLLQVRRGLRRVARGQPQVVGPRPRGPDEGADLVCGSPARSRAGTGSPPRSSRRACGSAERSDSSDERSTGANARTFASARSDARSEPGSRATDSVISRVLARERVEDAARGGHEPAQVLRVAAQLGHQQAVVVDQPLERGAAPGRRARDPGEVAVDRLEAAEHLAQVVPAARRAPSPRPATSSFRYGRVSASSAE